MPVDLKERMSFAARFVLANIDRQRDCLPYSAFMLKDGHWSLIHGMFDSPHMVGRFLDTLAMCSDCIDIPDDDEAFDGLARRLHGTIHADDGLAWNDVTASQTVGAVMHNQREVLLALLVLARWRSCPRSLGLAAQLVRGLARATNGNGCFPAGGLTTQGWDPSFGMSAAPAQSGRLIGALCDYYRVTNDELAVDLARELADHNLQHCFNEDGSWTDQAGSHVHSILGTITGIVDLGLLLDEALYVQRGRAAYEVGLSPYRSSYGWVKEHRGTPHSRGEANCTGDAVQAALLLGRAGYVEFFEDADRMIRNHLLASQVLDTTWINDSAYPNTPDVRYTNLRHHALGGFCMGAPDSQISHAEDPSPIACDLVHGATAGIVDAQAAAVDKGTSATSINLLIGHESADLTVRSGTRDGSEIEIELRKATTLRLRIPSWVQRSQIGVTVGGVARPVETDGSYVTISLSTAPETVTVQFPIVKRSTREIIDGCEYALAWCGNTVVSVEGPRGKAHAARTYPLAAVRDGI